MRTEEEEIVTYFHLNGKGQATIKLKRASEPINLIGLVNLQGNGA